MRIPWNEYEAAILLNACIEVRNGHISRKEAEAAVSQELRAMAEEEGRAVDSIYRNGNGIHMQFEIMNDLLLERRGGLHPAPRLFREMVGLYRRDEDSFWALLRKAKGSAVLGTAGASLGVDSHLAERLIHIADTQFPNGLRKASPVEIARLRRYFLAAYPGEALSEDLDLEAVIAREAVVFQGRYYIVSDRTKDLICSIVFGQTALGHQIFYYEALYERHMEPLQACHIFVVDVLRAMLERLLPQYFYHRSYFTAARGASLEAEITRCFDGAAGLTYAQLEEALPYVPLEKIKHMLAVRPQLIWVRTGEYVLADGIRLDEEESRLAEASMREDVDRQGFSSLSNQSFAVSLSQSPALSECALREAFYQRRLSGRYDRRGGIVYEKGTSFQLRQVLEAFCLEHDSLTAGELHAFEADITGGRYRRAMAAAYDTMVRVSRDLFVRTELVHFDVEQTDSALELFAAGRVIPLRAVTSFTSFPYVEGYSWNLYLLESFCRRFSKKYRFDCLSINSVNAGAVYPADRRFESYTDVMAEAVAAAAIPLYPDDVSRFLKSSGYVARRTDAAGEVIVKAQAVINQGG